MNPFLKRLVGEKSLLKVAIQEDYGEAGREVLDDVLLILNELMGRNTFTLGFIINYSDEAQVAKLSDCKALIFKPSPHIAHRARLLLVEVGSNVDRRLMSQFFWHHIFIAIV